MANVKVCANQPTNKQTNKQMEAEAEAALKRGALNKPWLMVYMSLALGKQGLMHLR